jgi:serine/threonine protein kinase
VPARCCGAEWGVQRVATLVTCVCSACRVRRIGCTCSRPKGQRDTRTPVVCLSARARARARARALSTRQWCARAVLPAVLPLQVCDFGLAKLKREAVVVTQRIGSPMWTAPEVLEGDERTEAADTFSFGMMLFELMTRQLPYSGISSIQVITGVITNLLPRPTLSEPVASLYPEELAALMCACWQHAHVERPPFDTILDEIELMEHES